MTRNIPQKRRDFARDCNDGDGGALAFGDEPAITRAKAGLRLPGNIANLLRQERLSPLMFVTNASGMTVGPSRLNQGFARAVVARSGDPALPPRFAS